MDFDNHPNLASGTIFKLTITRAQEGSFAQSVVAGWVICGTVTAKAITNVGDAIAKTREPAS